MPDASTLMPDPVHTGPICLLVNERSGANERDRNAIDAAREVLGPDAILCPWDPTSGQLPDSTRQAGLIVAAGGDGTAMGVAGLCLGREVPMAVLPLGTFNYFARGLGYSEDPAVAAQQVLDGTVHDISVGTVNGQVFLNNASLGIYPTILREREGIYDRWGRSRIAAHWSVLRTLLTFRRPMRVRIDVGDGPVDRRTALIFVGRSAFQLRVFGLQGEEAISEDGFAVFVARAERRRDLFRVGMRLAAGSVSEGEDYDLIRTARMTVEVPRRTSVLLAHDGEKSRVEGPLHFEMSPEPLRIVLPPEHPSA